MFRYHTGTLAFGSLIIAIIKAIRAFIQYIEDKLKEKGADKPPVKVLLCLCKCCFWCLEKFMKFINRNAYILTAINGTNFCSSAKEAFGLILRNCVRVVVLDKVTDFLLFLGKLVVTSIVALLSFFYFSGGLNDKVPFGKISCFMKTFSFKKQQMCRCGGAQPELLFCARVPDNCRGLLHGLGVLLSVRHGCGHPLPLLLGGHGEE